MLKQGVERWNQWRREHPEAKPDFRAVDFRYVDIGPVSPTGNFSYIEVPTGDTITHIAVRGGTDLRGIDLCRADLSGADLSMVNLSGANLKKADLNGTDLSGTDLRVVDLSAADLSTAVFHHTKLYGTNFSQVQTLLTIFSGVDLSHVEALETVRHMGPSSIGIDTIYRSQGKIPEVFLHGAGVPDTMIIFARSLTDQSLDYYTCFISYSSRDETFARRLYADLQSKGVRCWFAPEDLKIGDHYHQRIDESIRLYDKLVLILSERAVQSAWVEREVVAAREKEDREQRPVLFPLRLDDAVMSTTKAWAADLRRIRHIGDFTRWKNHDDYQKAFDRLLRDLKAETAQGGEPIQ